MIQYRKRNNYCHRVSFMLFHGDIPEGHVIRHTCDTPRCVNPAHLISGTQRENLADSYSRGRAVVGSRSHHAKVKEPDVSEIRKLRASGMKLKAIGGMYGLSEAAICVICNGKRWKHIPMPVATSFEDVEKYLETL